MKKQTLALAVLALTASFAHGVTYTLTNVAGNNSSVVVNSAGTRLTGNGASSTVIGSAAFGYFSASDSAISASTSGTELLTTFVPFSTNAGLFNNPTTPTNYQGLFSRSGTLTLANLDAFAGKNIYLVLTNAATISGGTEYLVYKFNSTYIGSGADTGGTLSFVIDTAVTNDGTLLLGTRTGPSLTAAGFDTSAEPSFQLQTLAAVPEPSAALLGMLGALGLLRRRR